MTPTAPDQTSAAAFFTSMQRLGFEYAGSTAEGGRFVCPHPGHEDAKPSLDVTIGASGKVLLNCKPCEVVFRDHRDEWINDLRDAGVRLAGLPCTGDEIDWGPRAPHTAKGPGGSGGERVNVKRTVYEYLWQDGTPNFRTLRFDYTDADTGETGKDFRVRRYVRGEGYPWGFAKDTVRTPWKLERFADWAADPKHDGVIYLVEGEKAARALHRQKFPATTFAGGADGKLEPEWPKWFAEFDDVRIWPDADGAGVLRARRLLSDLKAAGVHATVWGVTENVQPKDDAYDVLMRGEMGLLHRLSKADGEYLMSLAPAVERRVLKAPAGAAPRSLVVMGKTLVSAVGAGGPQIAISGDDDDDVVDATGHLAGRPYPMSVNVEPYRFAAEVVDRHFRNSDGVLTLRFREDDRQFWLWSFTHNRYEYRSDDVVKAILAKLLADAEETTPDAEVRPVKVKTKTWTDVMESIRLLTLTHIDGGGALLPATGGVPFRNGWLDAATGDLLPIGPERDIRWNVPADYSPDAGCPEWMGFLRSLGWGKDSEEYRLLRQWFGYLLSGSKDQEKAMLMIGPTRSGKGTTIRVAEALMGEGSVATSLDSLTANFGLQAMIGKGLATIPDARFGRSDKGLNARLLSLTSNDSLPVDVKYGKPLSLNLGVRLMMGTNEPPNFIEASDALSRRFVVLQYTRSFLGQEDKTLFARLRKEIPGIARWALGGIADLEGMGRFSETTSGKIAQESMVMESAFVRIFVEECCVLDPSAKISNDDLYNEYAVWADHHRMPVYNSVRFGRELMVAHPGVVENVVYKVRGKSVRGKSGVRLA